MLKLKKWKRSKLSKLPLFPTTLPMLDRPVGIRSIFDPSCLVG
jgi:hypothetical protein